MKWALWSAWDIRRARFNVEARQTRSTRSLYDTPIVGSEARPAGSRSSCPINPLIALGVAPSSGRLAQLRFGYISTSA